jgi:hypothetical protein
LTGFFVVMGMGTFGHRFHWRRIQAEDNVY